MLETKHWSHLRDVQLREPMAVMLLFDFWLNEAYTSM
jgi:hypothetical protein